MVSYNLAAQFSNNKATHRDYADTDESNIFKYAKQHYSHSKSMDRSIKLESVMKECTLKKYFFWKKNYHLYPDTKEKTETKKIIVDVSSYPLKDVLPRFVEGA